MVSKVTKVTNEMGFHMRPANIFVTAMAKYTSNINIIAGDKKINGKSIMNIMAACIKCGTEITVECDGTDDRLCLMKQLLLLNLVLANNI